MTKNQKILRIVLIVVAIVVIALLLWMLFDTGGPDEIDYQTDESDRQGLVGMIVNGEVQAVYVNGYTAYVLTVDQQMNTQDFLKNPTSSAKYFCYMPYSYALNNTVYTNPETGEETALSSMITLRYANAQSNSTITSLIVPIAGVIVIGIIIFFIFRQSAGANKQAMNFGKLKARVNMNVKVRFDDVAGADEEKEELQEIVEFLKSPAKFTALGARVPKGVLLVGPPGTGKTLFAKAVAGEAGVPFFSISGSDFVEMFVGTGAARVRDLFDQAKRNMPCIVFIDEIDAVGRQRGAGLGGGHDEREQTLNQLLVQMDGFEKNEGIIIMAATNRADILDPALLRPGRFDRQIYVSLPDVKGREAIFKVHSRNKPLAPDVSFKILARMTSGFSGADIENLLNEAAILAARAGRKVIVMVDLLEGINKVIAGPQKKSRVVTETDKRITAYHESGHALVAKLLPKSDPVHKVTIIPRGRALGVTMQLPEEDRYSYDRDYLLTRIAILFGGRIAEEVFMNQMTTGASNDFERASQLARDMVMRYGMSDKMGVMVYAENEGEVFLGRSVTKTTHISEKTMQQVDAEIRRILDEQYKRARDLIEGHQKEMHRMAKALLDWETIDGDQIDDILAGNEPRPPKSPMTGSAKPEPRKEEKVEEPVQEAKAPADDVPHEAHASDKEEPK